MCRISEMFEETRAELAEYGIPNNDSITDLPMAEFETGGHYGIELSSMNNFKVLSKAVELAKEYKLPISRMIECRGIVRLPDDEIRNMVKLCAEEKIGLVMSVGPRAISDIGAFAASPNGKRIGYRLRGIENVIHAIEDVKRGLRLGVRGFLVYDEGLLYHLNNLRKDGKIPADVIIKYSVHACCSNPLSAKLLEENGADSINLIPDLDIGMIAAFRPVLKGPLDVFSDTAKSAGGLLRTYDMPKVVRVASPVFLKCGPISQPEQNHLPTPVELEERIKQARNVYEHVTRYLPEAKLVGKNEKQLAIPCYDLSSEEESINKLSSSSRIFDHIGVPSSIERDGEIFLETGKFFVTPNCCESMNIEWLRFLPDSTMPKELQTQKHIAYVVKDLDMELENKNVLVEPFAPAQGVRVAFIMHEGVPVEFLEIEGKC